MCGPIQKAFLGVHAMQFVGLLIEASELSGNVPPILALMGCGTRRQRYFE
jgi:hypothetical protein